MIIYFILTILKRSYRYFVLSFLSLSVGALLLSCVLTISTSVNTFFIRESKVLLGGDLVLNAAKPFALDSSLQNFLQGEGHILDEESRVSAVFSTDEERTSPSSIRVVSNQFPLYGTILLSEGAFFLDRSHIIIDSALAKKLQKTKGNTITLNGASYTISGILAREPDAINVGLSFAPRVIMTKEAFESASIDLSESRASYYLRIKENPLKPLSNNIRDSIQVFAKENKLRYDSALDGPNNLVRGAKSLSLFAFIVLVIALILVTVNIIANLAYVYSKFKKTIALLKAFGITTYELRLIFIGILLLLGIVSGIVGGTLGSLIAVTIFPYIETYLSSSLPLPNISFIISTTALVSVGIVLVTTLPFLQKLAHIAPKELLRTAEEYRLDQKGKVGTTLSYLPSVLAIGLVMFFLTGELRITVVSIVTIVGVFIACLLLTHLVLSWFYRRKERFSFITHSILSFLHWRGAETLLITSSIMTGFLGVFIITTLEANITKNLQYDITRSAPSLYLVDITKSQLTDVSTIAGKTFVEYPIVRGRLLSVNDRDFTTSEDRSLTREFNMTYRNNLIKGEEILEGRWHGTKGETSGVSFDKDFGDTVGGIKLGDTVRVFIQGITITEKVTSIRSSDRSQGTPFFYMVFPPTVLEKFPASYFGTVTETNEETLTKIQNELGIRFPNIIPIETKNIIQTFASITSTIVLVVTILGIPSILLGILLVTIMTIQSLYERRNDVLVLITFGLTKKRVFLLFICEVISIIGFAGIITYTIAQLISYFLNKYFFSFEMFTISVVPFVIITITLSIATLVAYSVTRDLIKTPIKKLLSEK